MDFDESQFRTSEADRIKQDVIKYAQYAADNWPEMIALWNGMVTQCLEAGWTEYAARSLVLSNVTAHNLAIAVNVPGVFDDEMGGQEKEE